MNTFSTKKVNKKSIEYVFERAEKIKSEISKLLSKASGIDEQLAFASLEIPKNNFGDLSSRIAFDLVKERKSNPSEIAKEIVSKIQKHEYVEKIVATGPYINFFFSTKYFSEISEEIAKNCEYWQWKEKKTKTIIEFPSVNPNKPWHIGHLRNALIGDSVARILSFSGETIETIDYIDDLGLQIAQSVYEYMHIDASKKTDFESGINTNEKFDHQIGKLYVSITAKLEKNPELEKKIKEILEQMECGKNKISEKARQMCEKVIDAQYETNFALGISHDVLIFESDIIRTIFSEGMEKLKKSEAIRIEKQGKNVGCLIMQLDEKYGELINNQKVLIRSNGTATYTAKDIIFQFWKFGLLSNDFVYTEFKKQPNGKIAYITTNYGKKMKFGHANKVINIIGVEQSHPQIIIKDILNILGYENKSQNFIHLAYDHVVLPEGTFSGRQGTWFGSTADEFIKETKKRAIEKITKKIDENRKIKIAEKIGIAAIKFSFLRVSPEKKIVFNWENALSLEGDSGPYIQYAYVRTLGILKKCSWQRTNVNLKINCEFTQDEKELVKQISIFGTIVKKAANDLRPHYIADYVLELSTLFNKFYTKNPVLKAENENEKIKRIVIVAATSNVLKNALSLLGIDAPDEM